MLPTVHILLLLSVNPSWLHYLRSFKGSVVALKKILLKRLEDGIPETALREIKALQVNLNVNSIKEPIAQMCLKLQALDSEHVVRLYDMFPQGPGFVLVFEFMQSDLSEAIHDYENPLTPPQVRLVHIHAIVICSS